MLWTLFKLQCVHIGPPCSHRGHSKFVPLRHQESYPNTEETKLAHMQPGNSLLHFRVFCKLPASQELHKGSKEMDVTGQYIETVQRVDLVLQNCPNQSQVLLAIGGSSDFDFFGPLNQQLAEKRFAADTNMQQAVTSLLQTFDNYFFHVGIYASVPQ
jgi:hypothetical protein